MWRTFRHHQLYHSTLSDNHHNQRNDECNHNENRDSHNYEVQLLRMLCIRCIIISWCWSYANQSNNINLTRIFSCKSCLTWSILCNSPPPFFPPFLISPIFRFVSHFLPCFSDHPKKICFMAKRLSLWSYKFRTFVNTL